MKIDRIDTIMNDLNHSRNLAARPHTGCVLALFLLAGLLAMRVTQAADLAATNTASAIPWNQIAATAGVDYQCDALSVMPNESGALLDVVLQRPVAPGAMPPALHPPLNIALTPKLGR